MKIRLVFCLAALIATPIIPANAAPDAAWYTQHVLPILETHCLKCHSAETHKSEFRLDYRNLILVGGELGPGYDAAAPSKSGLLKMISYVDENHEMPPKGKLPQADIDIITEWVLAGLPMPEDRLETEIVKKGDPPHLVTEERRQQWPYYKVTRPTPPANSQPGWNDNMIDQYVFASLQTKGLLPNPRASRETLIRRASYNLIGLPPSSAEVDAFVNDPADDKTAFAKVVDTLLARPQYGEKWGRHWLDVVRYAESNGYERDSFKPEVWRYRDWVINAFNRDLPYTDFVRHQLAGDELAPGDAEALKATGFYRLGVWDDEPADRPQQKYDILDGIADTAGRGFLGLSMGCARCHDSKIDPIPQADYYSWLAFFHNVKDVNNKGGDLVEIIENQTEYDAAVAERREQEGDLQKTLHDLEQQVVAELEQAESGLLERTDLTDVRYKFYRDTFEKLPDFDGLLHENEGAIANNLFDLGVATRNDAIGFVFTGKLIVPTTGTYTFKLDSTDGSRLLINGQRLIDYDGRHPAGKPRQAELALKDGAADIRVEYFNHSGPNLLDLTWSGPGVAERPLTRSGLADGTRIITDGREGGDSWQYTTTAPPGNWMSSDFIASGWKLGTSGFGTSGTPRIKVATDWTTSDIWLRKEIHLAAIPWQLTQTLFHDENISIYLNGELIDQRKGYVADYLQEPLKGAWKKIIRPGRNVIAIHCHQTAGGQGIDFGLIAGRPKKGTGPDSISPANLVREHGRRILGADDFKRYNERKKELVALKKQPIKATSYKVMAVVENGTRLPETFILRRGSPYAPGDKVEPRFPSIISDAEPPAATPVGNSSGWRSVLANWIASDENRLTARVAANRIWQHHFGKGIVATSSDFGNIGSGATHPELLDALAWTFSRDLDWSMKALHRQMITSATWCQSSRGRPDALAADPDNTLLWRANMRRLTAEEIRDSLINVTGQLNLKMGGEGFYSAIPADVLATASTGKGKWSASSDVERNRRAIYNRLRRSLLDPLLAGFDLADTDNPCPVRFATTVPTQALTMLNSEFVNDKALELATRLRKDAAKPADRVRLGLELATNRKIHDAEIADGLAMLADMKTLPGVTDDIALERFCLLLLNLNEFLFID